MRCEFKLCDFDNSRLVGEMMSVEKYSKSWVSPEVYVASNSKTQILASTSIDMFSLGLIVGTLLDGNCHRVNSILPADNVEYFHRALSDQDYLNSLLHCNGNLFYKKWVHKMCSINPNNRCNVRMIIQDLEDTSRTKLAVENMKIISENDFMKGQLVPRLNDISQQLDHIQETMTVGFVSLRSNLKDLVQSSFEHFFNNSNGENTIFHKILSSTEDFSKIMNEMKNNNSRDHSSDDNNFSVAKAGLKRMEEMISEALESHMNVYEAERKQEMILLQSTILSKYKSLENLLEIQSADSKDIQTTINNIAVQATSLHQELVEIHHDLSHMKANLIELSNHTRDIVTSNEKLKQSIDFMNEEINRISESNQQEFHRLNKKLQGFQMAIEDGDDVDGGLQSKFDVLNSQLLILLKGAYDIPTLVILLPEIATGVTSVLRNPSRLFSNKYRLYFVCSHTLCIAPCGPKGLGYKLSTNKEWVRKAAPVLMVGLVALKLALATSGIPFPISDLLSGLSPSAQSDYFDAALRNLQAISTSTVTESQRMLGELTKEECLSFLNRDAEGTRSAYESIKEMLKNYPNIVTSCGLVFAQHKGKVAWVLKDQVDHWKSSLEVR